MKTKHFLKASILLLMNLQACQSDKEMDPAISPSGDTKAAAVNTLSYDNFMDNMDLAFTNIPACPANPGDWTRCGYSSNGRWARLSWNWSACPLSPYKVSTLSGNLLMEVPGNNVKLGGQIESLRNDYSYGSYRARIRAGAHSGASTEGTCSAFFFYNSATTQEIDVEILNREHDQWKVHFVTHPGDYQIIYTLPYDPTSEFIEYGFDWYKNKIDFVVNGIKVTPSQTKAVPSVRGTIMLNHWTGNSGWSGTPPPVQSVMTVDYVWHAPFLLLTWPDESGIILKRNDNMNISWNKYGDIAASQVNIEIWKGGKLYKTIASAVANTGSYSFKIPSSYPVSDNYRIKVKSALSADYYDFSNYEFRIQ
jgi:hypothetical protein